MFVFLRKGPLRESNSRPLAPKARIIPLDQAAWIILIMIPILSTSSARSGIWTHEFENITALT